MRKILVITHDAFLTGAPILLLQLMSLLKEEGYQLNTIIRIKGGPLTKDFQALSAKCNFYQRSKAETFSNKLKKKLLGSNYVFDVAPFLDGVDCVINNTITNGEILSLVRKHYNGPVFSYIHELKMAGSFFTSDHFICKTIELSDHFFVPCNAVKNHLLQTYKISETEISFLNYYIPDLPSASAQEIAAFRNKHKISASFIIGSLGSIGWRKATDIFLLVASSVFKKMPEADIQFVWMGGTKENVETKKMMHDIDKLQLQNKVIVLEESPDTSLFFKNIDLFLLPSREDPYPLVVLEAAAEKIASVCFDGAGGASEFVCPDAGSVVPYLDIEAMAGVLITYYKNAELLTGLGANAFDKVKRLHKDKKLIIEQFDDAVKKGSLYRTKAIESY